MGQVPGSKPHSFAGPDQVLGQVFGFAAFRKGQREAIDALLSKRSVILLMPTGMGKSLTFQVPALLLPGVTLVVSPLIALMKDQVDAARKKGIRAAFINSSLDREGRERAQKQLADGEIDLLYVTPERFKKADFWEALSKVEVSLLAVDEAHCISQWGHDFRPEYSRLREIRESLKKPTTIALTATATPDVEKDILVQLGLDADQVVRIHEGIERPNLSLRVEDLYGLDSKLRAVVALRHLQPGPTIIYTSLIGTIHKVSSELQKLGLQHGIYHGDLPDRLRKSAQDRFLKSEDGLMLATPAFGLGIDKPNIRMVIHLELPGSLEAYFQEVGRAGRDGAPAQGVLLFDEEDATIQMDFIKWANPEPAFTLQVFKLVKDNPDRVKAEGLDFLRGQMHFYNKRDYRIETSLNLLERWGSIEWDAARRVPSVVGLDTPSGSWLDQKVYEARMKVSQTKLLEMIRYAKAKDCRAQIIERYFGLTAEKTCGQCDNCMGAS